MGRPSSHNWTPEEEDMIRRLYPKLGPKKLSEKMNIPRMVITNRANYLGVKFHRDFMWTDRAIQLVKNNYKKHGPQKIAGRLGISHWAVTAKARRLGLELTRKAPRTLIQKRYARTHGGRSKNTDKRTAMTYQSWRGMIARCNYPTDHRNYKYYGAKGIKVCRRWMDPDKGFLNFVEDMSYRPSKDHSIDRIDCDVNYKPSNCRWATWNEQNRNLGVRSTNKSGYKGVILHGKGVWKASIHADKVSTQLGLYSTKQRAAYAYNIAARILHGEFAKLNKNLGLDKEIRIKIKKKVREKLGHQE